MAGWIAGPVAERLPDAVRCVDPFHVVQLATDALNEIRREVWNDARKNGEVAAATDLKGARYALWKNPENLTDGQKVKLADVQKPSSASTAPTCSRSSCDRSTGSRRPPRSPCSTGGSGGPGDVAWRRSSSSPAPSPSGAPGSSPRSSTVSQTPGSKRSTPRSGWITRRAFGFHSPGALIALAMPSLAALCPPLPR